FAPLAVGQGHLGHQQEAFRQAFQGFPQFAPALGGHRRDKYPGAQVADDDDADGAEHPVQAYARGLISPEKTAHPVGYNGGGYEPWGGRRFSGCHGHYGFKPDRYSIMISISSSVAPS